MKKYHKKFLTKKELYIALGEATSKMSPSRSLDTDAMLAHLKKGSPYRFYIFTKDGKKRVATNTKLFFHTIKGITKLNICPHLCYNQGTQVMNVFSTEDYFNTENDKKKTVVVEKEEKSIEDISAEVGATEREQVASEEESLPPMVDMDHAKALLDEADLAASKIALERYARTFGIELKRNKKFENMLLDLQAATAP